MAVNLNSLLSRFKNIEDFESKTAFYKTRIPWAAPFAYLNILYKPVTEELRHKRVNELSIPKSLADFYRSYNGANLFADFLRISGFRPDSYVLDRKNWQDIPAYDIRDIEERHAEQLREMNLVCFADYSFDGSYVCIDRSDEKIVCFKGKNFTTTRLTWASFEQWISSEIARIAFYFDQQGKRLVAEDKLLPGEEPPGIA